MIFYLLLICFLHALGAHRVKESTNVIKHKPVDGGTYDRDVEHAILSPTDSECNTGDNY